MTQIIYWSHESLAKYTTVTNNNYIFSALLFSNNNNLPNHISVIIRKAMVNSPCRVPTGTKNIPIFTLFATNNPAPINTAIPPNWANIAKSPIGANTNVQSYLAVSIVAICILMNS